MVTTGCSICGKGATFVHAVTHGHASFCSRSDCPHKIELPAEDLISALRDENARLRVMLAFVYAGASLYTDDGELQDNREIPAIDFKRDTVVEIERAMHERVKRYFARMAQVPSSSGS